MALVPLVLARLPIMGTRKLVESGMKPLFSSIFLIFFSYIGYLITEAEKSKDSKMKHWLCNTNDVCTEKTEFGKSGIKIDNKSLFILCFVFAAEFFIQLLWLYYTERENALKMTKAVTNALKTKSKK